MARLMTTLWDDDDGALIATEFMLVAVISVIGLVVGLTYVRNAVTSKLSELSQAYLFLDVGYQFPSIQGANGGNSVTPYAFANGSHVINRPHIGVFTGNSTLAVPVQDIQNVPAPTNNVHSSSAQ